MITTSKNDHNFTLSGEFFTDYVEYLHSQNFTKDIQHIILYEKAFAKDKNLTTHKQILKNVYTDDNTYDFSSSYFVYNFETKSIYIIKKFSLKYNEVLIKPRAFYQEDIKKNWLKLIKEDTDFDNKLKKLIDYLQSDFENTFNYNKSYMYKKFLESNNSDDNFSIEKSFFNYATFQMEDMLSKYNKLFEKDNAKDEINHLYNIYNNTDIISILCSNDAYSTQVINLIDQLIDYNLVYEISDIDQFSQLIHFVIKENKLTNNLMYLLVKTFVELSNGAYSNDFNCYNLFKKILDFFDEKAIQLFKQVIHEKEFNDSLFRTMYKYDQYDNGLFEKNNLFDCFKMTLSKKDFTPACFNDSTYYSKIDNFNLLYEKDLIQFKDDFRGSEVYDSLVYIKQNGMSSLSKELKEALLELC